MILDFEISRKNRHERCLCGANGSHFQDYLFPSPIICVDSISAISLITSLLPTEQKTASWEQKRRHVFRGYFKIPGTYHFSEARFGIYAKSCIYMDIFWKSIDFPCELGPKACIWSKSCFCCSRNMGQVPDRTDHGFEFTVVESISH